MAPCNVPAPAPHPQAAGGLRGPLWGPPLPPPRPLDPMGPAAVLHPSPISPFPSSLTPSGLHRPVATTTRLPQALSAPPSPQCPPIPSVSPRPLTLHGDRVWWPHRAPHKQQTAGGCRTRCGGFVALPCERKKLGGYLGDLGSRLHPEGPAAPSCCRGSGDTPKDRDKAWVALWGCPDPAPHVPNTSCHKATRSCPFSAQNSPPTPPVPCILPCWQSHLCPLGCAGRGRG